MGRRKTKNPPLGWKTKRQQQKIEAEGRRDEGVQRVRKTSRKKQIPRPPDVNRMITGMMGNVKYDMMTRPYQLLLEGRFEEAIGSAEDAMVKEGTATNHLMAKAEALRQLGRLKEALAVSKEQMQYMDRIEYQHATILYETGKIRELEKLCDDWEKIDGPDDPFLVVNRARILFKKGNTEEAVPMLKDAILDGQVEDYGYIPLIEIMIHGGNTDEALRLCDEAYRCSDATAKNNICRIQAEILLDTGDVKRARSLCSGVLARWPHHATFLALQERINSQ